MSIARPTAAIRRAVALPLGLLDFVDASLEAGFSRVDSAVDRRIRRVSERRSALSQGISRSTNSLDRALDGYATTVEVRSKARVTKVVARFGRLGSGLLKFEVKSDSKLNRSLQKIDRATLVGTAAATATLNASVALAHRTDNKITRGFSRIDVRTTNVANRAHRRQAKTINLVHRYTSRIDQRIDTDYLRADARVNAGIAHTVSAIKTTSAQAGALTRAVDTRVTNAVTRIDSRIDRRIAQNSKAAISTAVWANTKAMAFEKAMDLGISRADSRIANGKARGVAATISLVDGVAATDRGLSGVYARIDSRADSRITQVTSTFARASTLVSNCIESTDAILDDSLATFDLRIATGVNGFMQAASGIAFFVSGQVDDLDGSLTRRLSLVDGKVDTLVDLVNGQPGRHASQPRTSLPWAATSLTLVLGTLGAATGASAVTANSLPLEIDNTVKIEASAAKNAVTQYLSVRESFQTLQASRSRSIQSLEQEIAAAEARITQTGLSGKAIIDVADNYGGVPYVRGGTTPKGFDCSGYTKHVFAQLGVNLPRTSSQQHAWSDKVSFDDRKVGDLMFWANSGGVHHVAIYAGDGKMWDSPRPGRRVGKVSIWGSPTYGRVPTDEINASALKEIATKKTELEKIKAEELRLEITVNPKFILPTNGDKSD